MKKFLRVCTSFGLAVLIMFGASVLTSCDSGIETSKYNDVAKTDPDFADCVVKKVMHGGNSIIMARCPNSTTAVDYPYGKSRATSITVDSDVADYRKAAALAMQKQKAARDALDEQERKNALYKLTNREIELLGLK